jgi:hypothetical protein
MALSFGVRCSRIALFVFNVIFLLIGLSVLGLGIYIKVNGNFSAVSEIYSISEALGGETMKSIGIGMIVTGVFTVCLSGFGCLGMSITIIDNKYKTLLYLFRCYKIQSMFAISIFNSSYHYHSFGICCCNCDIRVS